MSHILHVLAGEGPHAWDLTHHVGDQLVHNLVALWKAPSLREAIASLNAPLLAPAPPVEGTADPLSQLCFRLAQELLAPVTPQQRETTAIILGTTYGCLRADIDFDLSRRDSNGRYASPAAFRNTLPTHIPAEISVKLNLHGPVFALSSPDPLALALQRATAWQQPLTITGVFDWPINAEPRAIFVLVKHLV